MSARAPEQIASSCTTPEREFILSCLGEIYQPREIPVIADWLKDLKLEITADQNTSYSGQHFDPDRFPVVSRLVFKFYETPGVYELFALKPVQSAFTTHVWFALCHGFIYRPCTGILVMHTRQEVRKKKKDTYTPIIAAIPDLKDGGKVANRADGAETTAEEFRFTNSTLYVGGGQTASVLTSTGANRVTLDEAEQHPKVNDTTTINLARGRMTGGDEWRKLCAFSKPEKEARFEKNAKTGALEYQPEDGTYLHAEYLSGNQMRYECPCPHCGVFVEPSFKHIRFSHCRVETLPGMPPQWDKAAILQETYWECPKCQGRVREGEEKKRWVMAGHWVETPLAERKAKDMYPRPEPRRWSAQFSALTDIAFDSLTWGSIALRFLDAQNDPVKLRAFNNELLGIPEPTVRSEDINFDQIHRLIPGPDSKDPPPWQMKLDGVRTGIIPLNAFQVSYIGMTADNQKATVKYRVRAYGKDGRSYLLDYGEFPAQPGFPDLRNYLNTTLFTTLDGHSSPIWKCYMDIQGTRWYDAIDLCLAETGRVVATAGAKESLQTTDRVWPVKVNAKSGRPLYCL